ncbi:host cell attachment protein [Candidatus Bealeia paramacronuclearis]|uniref:Host cell attachment protein n=1 Tax=Candidatus Bealeia paramacronuclearis TaxID=1921001 RepID=A0ABZ2C0C1_9PROT|nr:Protein required for attachment to host cells [Candidatus Bealeia paramacronuclearis]
MKGKIVWVLVADGARGRFFQKKPEGILHIDGFDFVAENLKDQELTHDKPGRGFESANPARHAYQPRVDPHENQKVQFAKRLSEFVNKAREKGEFDELVLVTPPKILGELRNHLGKDSLSKVTSEIAKDVSKFSDHELNHYLQEMM